MIWIGKKIIKNETELNHLLYLIDDLGKNVEIYRKFFNYLDYKIITDEDYALAVMTPNKTLIWFMESSIKTPNNRDSRGLNHFGISVESKADVDKFVEEFLQPNNLECLFETPRERKDFTGENGMYYQVMFELPGSCLFEVVYTSL